MIVLASDHAGVDLKAEVARLLDRRGDSYRDLGPIDSTSVDYPDYAHQLAREILSTRADRGVLICGTGIGMSMTVNRFKGVRAALVHDAYTARMAKAHNDANVLALGARVLGTGVAEDAVEEWLSTEFEGGRHKLRIDLIDGD